MSAPVTAPAVDTFPPGLEERLATGRQVADAVLFEGYVLYPYRASAAKNQLRWQFGVLVPPGYGQDSAEHSVQRTECLLEPRAGARLAVELRFLRARRRTVQRGLGAYGYRTVPELELPDRVLVPWDEGVVETVRLLAPVDRLLAPDGVTHAFRLAAGLESEPVVVDGERVGRLLRAREEVAGVIRLSARELPGPYGALRLTAVVANTSGWRAPDSGGGDGGGTDRTDAGGGTGGCGRDGGADRAAALPHSLVSAHLLLAVDRGVFLSATDPPRWAAPAVAECRNEHTWPVLADADGRDDVLLSSPIILEDRPRIAPESPLALYDATEIDEILALRTACLTDREKREARGTDERAGAVVDFAASMPREVLERLHGTVRSLRDITGGGGAGASGADAEPWWDPGSDPDVDPARDRVLIGGRSVGAGSRVLLRPGRRRTDAQDLFLDGRAALVEAVLHDVDGSVHLAVTIEDDPGADLWRAQGRFRYFQPDEVTPLEAP
ncbi:hypothetical protein [Streptomyces yaizuensis]|uniref:Uncharacterized protein n=1 Tax=Streptomyces yaizuensis TaxID=2989713 RepID=A0ABQ5NYS5_9ACTN|nr:hypothetical protein [Streptomyces sp. YSPA8]GLF95409.1 hypothetical protein SYYSPA8_13950 [Streptomyces sp. YSPA8]